MADSTKKELSLLQRILYSTGEMGVTLSPSIIVGWLLFFYTGQVDEAGNKIYIVGFGAFAALNFFGRMVDSVADPFVGYLSDRFRTRMGRRIPWVVFGAPFLTFFSIILWYPPSHPGSWMNIAWLAFGLAGFWFFYTAVVAPYLSMLPEITFDNDERIEISSYMAYGDVLGMLVATVFLGLMISAAHGSLDLAATGPDGDEVYIRYAVEEVNAEEEAAPETPAATHHPYWNWSNQIEDFHLLLKYRVIDKLLEECSTVKNRGMHLDLCRPIAGLLDIFAKDLKERLEAPVLYGHFHEPLAVKMGSRPVALAVSDINKDGIKDLITANEATNDATIRLGFGEKAFGEPVSYPMGRSPVDLVVFDVNTDGYQDLVTANAAGNDITLRFGRKGGEFGETRTLPMGDAPASLLIADLNGDERSDLLTANRASGDLTFRLNLGRGEFGEVRSLSIGRDVRAAWLDDINRDDRPDLLAASYGEEFGAVTLRLGDKSHFFSYEQKLPETKQAAGVTAYDFNKDGRIDLAASCADRIAVFPGLGDGNFKEPTYYETAAAAQRMILRDLDDDGNKDIIFTMAGNQRLGVLLSRGEDGFAEVQYLSMNSAAIGGFIVADVDGGGLWIFPDGYKFAGWIFGIAMMFFFWLSVLKVREKPHDASKEVPFKFWEAFNHCLKNPAFIPYVFAVSFFRVAVDLLVAMIPFMVTVIMGYKEDIAGYLQGGIVILSLPLFAVVYKASAKYGKKKIFLSSQLLFALMLPLLVTMKHFPVFGWLVNWIAGGSLDEGAMVLIHICALFLLATYPIASVFVLPRAIFADIIDLDAQRTGYRREAMYNGMEGLLTKFAAGIATVVAPLLLAYGGDTADKPWGVLLPGPIAGVFLLLGYLSFRFYPIEK